MTFARLTFLILVLAGLNIFAQTKPQTFEQNNKPQAYKVDEYRKITIKKLEPRLQNYFLEVAKSCSIGNCGKGNIVIYAPNEKKAYRRLKQLRRFYRLHSVGGFVDRFDIFSISLFHVRGKNEKVEFWFIPKGAEPPRFEKAVELTWL